METLKQQVRRARRRLTLQRFLGILSWCCFATLLAAAALVGIDKVRPLGIEPGMWLHDALGLGAGGEPLVAELLSLAVWVGGALGLGALVALIWAWATRQTELDAALEIDRRFGLKERVSSTLALDASQRGSAAGMALVEDAVKRVERIHVAEQFRLRFNRWTWLPLAPAALAFLLAMFVNPAGGGNPAGGSPTAAQRKQVKTSTEVLRRKLQQRSKLAREKGLKDAEELFTKLEQGSQQLAKADQSDRKQALIKLNDLARDLEKRRTALAGSEKLKEQLNQLKNLQRGPGDKLADALRKGDFEQANKELNKLREQLERGKLDDKAKQELARQMADIEQKLRQMAEAHRKMQKELRDQLAEKRARGQSKEADELEKQLARLARQGPHMKNMEKLAEQVGQCARCVQQGDKDAAVAALDSIETELGKLAEQLDELEMLDEALDEIAQAKDSMNCPNCGGDGCADCEGRGDGDGLGRGRGARPEEKTKTGFYDTRVKQKLGKGAAVVTDLVEGPNVKGQVEQEIRTQFESARGDAADPLTGQQLPRTYRDHARNYFDALREGE